MTTTFDQDQDRELVSEVPIAFDASKAIAKTNSELSEEEQNVLDELEKTTSVKLQVPKTRLSLNERIQEDPSAFIKEAYKFYRRTGLSFSSFKEMILDFIQKVEIGEYPPSVQKASKKREDLDMLLTKLAELKAKNPNFDIQEFMILSQEERFKILGIS